MIKLKNKYDLVIYGAGIWALEWARLARKNFHDILVINEYGFAGGALSENLCCLQTKPAGSVQIINLLNKPGLNIAKEIGQFLFIDPELAKYHFMEILLAENIDILWHVSPLSLNLGERKLLLNAREGQIQIMADYFVDASETGLFARVAGLYKFMPQIGYYNFFVKGDSIPRNENIMQFQLAQKNYILSMRIANNSAILNENMILDDFEKYIRQLRKSNTLVTKVPVCSIHAGEWKTTMRNTDFICLAEKLKFSDPFSILNCSLKIENLYNEYLAKN